MRWLDGRCMRSCLMHRVHATKCGGVIFSLTRLALVGGLDD
jgi:hypothetical protein